MDAKRRWKSLSFKIEHLRLELEDRLETIEKYERDFLAALAEVAEEDVEMPPEAAKEIKAEVVVKDFSVPDPEPKEITPEPEPEDRPEEMRKLWRTIAATTHPDKTGGDEEKTKLYKRASEAWKTGAFDELCTVASILGIMPPDPSGEGVQSLESLSKSLQKKLEDFERNVLWIWGTSPPDKRDGILDIYLKSKGKKRKQRVQK